MFIAILIILAVISVAIGVAVKFRSNYIGDEALLVGISLAVVFLFLSAFGIQCNLGEKKLTGYIYSAEDGFGDKTTGHIRFSLNSGEDKQPSFCVKKSDSWKLKELAGSEKKVTITIPVGFKIGNPWDCLIPAEVKE